jgi:hypothetical protein
MTATVTEKVVVGIWQDILLDRTKLKTVDNEPVSVIYPGRLNDDRGADFKDAIITTRRGQARGDIEIHVKTSHWWTHRHHLDPYYNRVILHVVYQHDTTGAIALENGLTIPTLALRDYLCDKNNCGKEASIPCRSIGYGNKVKLIAERLDEAGEARFMMQARNYIKMITELGAGQTLYRGIMTALGYSKNKEAMAKLSRLMPLARLEALASEAIRDNEYLARCQAYLLGAAGLLPSQRQGYSPASDEKETWETKLESIWAATSQAEMTSLNNWHFFKVRPSNSPVRRLAAMSHLLLRYRQKGLLEGLDERLKEIADTGEASSLEDVLIIPPDSYWSRYLDFGLPCSGIAPALLGKERATEIIINVLLPFFYARQQEEHRKKVFKIYSDYRAPEENTLVKHMRQQLGITRFLVNAARRQQGLIHIYKTWCSEGKCHECPLADMID